jgi:SWIM zinc finger
MSLLLSPLREVSLDRHNRAVQGLKDGSLIVTLTFKTEQEVRGFVTNGDSVRYGVTLTEHRAFCSCPDAMYRGGVCKHAVTLCVKCLQKTEAIENPIPLWFPDGTAALCGDTHPKRFWQRWNWNVFNWPDVCPACIHAWTQPVKLLPKTKDEYFAVPADDRRVQEAPSE